MNKEAQLSIGSLAKLAGDLTHRIQVFGVASLVSMDIA